MDKQHTSGQPKKGETLLSKAFNERITQLGISRRQLTRQTGLSRQTLHKIENEGATSLRPSTYAALDTALLWRAGTAIALANGDASALTDDADMEATYIKEGSYRWQIIERISRMSLLELERMVSLMENEALGTNGPMETNDVIAAVEANVMARIERLLSKRNGESVDGPTNGGR